MGKRFEDSFVEWWSVRLACRLLFRQGLLAEGEHHRIALVVDNRLVEEDTDPVGLADHIQIPVLVRKEVGLRTAVVAGMAANIGQV